MGFFIAMFLCNLLMPSIMVIAGYCMYKNPPKEINGLIGYRTAMSEKNKDTWAFAHDYCGKLWIKSGIILLVPTVLVQIPFAKSGEDVVGTVTLVIEAVQVLALIGSVILVEKALKRTFAGNWTLTPTCTSWPEKPNVCRSRRATLPDWEKAMTTTLR